MDQRIGEGGMGECEDGLLNGWVGGKRIDLWMVEWMDGWMNGLVTVES